MDYLGRWIVRPVWRRSPGPDSFPAPSNTCPWHFAQMMRLTGKACAQVETCSLGSTHRKLYRHGLPPAGLGARRLVRCQRKARLQAVLHAAVGRHVGSSPRRGRCTSHQNWRMLEADQYRLRPGLRRPSLCACRSFRCCALQRHRPCRCPEAPHTLLDAAGQHSNESCMPHISGWQAHDVHALRYASCREAGAHLRRGSVSYASTLRRPIGAVRTTPPRPSSSRVPSRDIVMLSAVFSCADASSLVTRHQLAT